MNFIWTVHFNANTDLGEALGFSIVNRLMTGTFLILNPYSLDAISLVTQAQAESTGAAP